MQDHSDRQPRSNQARRARLNRRVQVRLDEERYENVAYQARIRDISIAEVIRRAIDALPDHAARRDAAIAAILQADRVTMPEDPNDVRVELDAVHALQFRSSPP